jgi:hypothetical protein
MSERRWVDVVRKWSAALAILAMVAGGIGIAVVMIFGNKPPAPAQRTAAPRTTLAPPPPSVPTPVEFTIGVVVTEQNCDPLGGCVYLYTIEPKYIGLHPLPTTPFTVHYEVTGGHQPQKGEFTVHKNQAQIMKDVTLEGPAGARLQAAVTRVIG